MTYKDFKLELNKKYIMETGYVCEIISKGRDIKTGKKFFIGHNPMTGHYWRFNKKGMPAGAPNSRISCNGEITEEEYLNKLYNRG